MTATLFIRITAPVQGCLQLLPSFSGLYRSLFFLLKKIKIKKVYAHDPSYLACLMIFISLPTLNNDNKKEIPEMGFHGCKMSQTEQNLIPFNERHILFEETEEDCKHY